MSDYLSHITRCDVQKFIADHEQENVQDLVLRYREILGVPSSWIATQITGRQKAKEKLPLWYHTPGIVYPPSVNLEQCSSEMMARYKQGLVNGHHAVDLTGGFGVDGFFFSRKFEILDHVEPDETLLAIASHNHRLLGAGNIRYHRLTAEKFIKRPVEAFDLVYADPSRRVGSRRVFRLSDASPDVVAMEKRLLERSREVIIKASPRLDLRQAFRELPSIDQFIVLAFANECKELLLILRRGHPRMEPTIHAVSLDKDGEPSPFAFTWAQEKAATVAFGRPKAYLYEPNAAILKAGAFKLIGQRYGLTKLGPDSHFYTADEKHDEFPGRVFRVIEQVSPYKNLRGRFEGGQANIVVRNYPLSVSEVARKSQLTEGGTDYLICTRSEKPLALVAKRLR